MSHPFAHCVPGLELGAQNVRDENFKESQPRMCESLTSALWAHAKTDLCRGTWVAQSVKCLTLDLSSGHELMVHEFEPCFWLCTDSSKPNVELELMNHELMT